MMKQVFIFIMTWTLNNNNSPWGSNPKGNEPNRGNGSHGDVILIVCKISLRICSQKQPY